MSVYVFVGPTLPVEEARRILDACYLPPVSLGDVHALVETRQPRAIAIIDGVFDQEPSVWHKEILFALSRGVRVFGSSSMGALRGAELHAYGMEGIGEIFAAFLRGDYEDDDEVAVAHAPASEGWRQLSEPMVNIRLGLERAEARGIIHASTRAALVTATKALFYPERSWAAVRRLGRTLGIPEAELEELLEHVRQQPPDAKRDDAVALLQTLRRELESGLAPHVPSFAFEPTYTWQKLVTIGHGQIQDRQTRERVGLGIDQIRQRLVEAGEHEAPRSALFLHLVWREAARLGLRPLDGEAFVEQASRLRQRWGLEDDDVFADWKQREHVDDADFRDAVQLEWFRSLLQKRYHTDSGRFLRLVLQRERRLGSLARAPGD